MRVRNSCQSVEFWDGRPCASITEIGPRRKGDYGRLIERTQDGMNSKLHAVGDANGRPFAPFMTTGQVNES